MDNKEYVLWATKIGAQDWQEDLITCAVFNKDGAKKIQKAIIWAKSNQFHKIRVSVLDLDKVPNFLK